MEIRSELLLLALLVGLWAPGAHADPVNHGARGRPGWQQRDQRWRTLPPERRQQILQARRRFRRLPPEVQRRLWQQYQRTHRREGRR